MALPHNLDYFTAEAALRFKDVEENVIQKAIAVLSSQGLFAMFLWSYAKDDYKPIAHKCGRILQKQQLVEIVNPTNAQQSLEALKDKLKDFETICFLEELVMQILTYARHYCKAVKVE